MSELNQLARAQHRAGQLGNAIQTFSQILQAHPRNSDALHGMGVALHDAGRLDEAIAIHRRAIALDEKVAEVWSNLGNSLLLKGDLDGAIDSFQHAIQLKPNWVTPLNNLAVAYKERGENERAVEIYRRAIALAPDNAVIHSALLYTLHFLPTITPDELLSEHRAWAARFADPLQSQWRPHTNSNDPHRPLRIGYASPDFRIHPIGRFMLPLLVNHDREKFEVYCYSWTVPEDDLTSRLKRFSPNWRDLHGLTDEEAAEQIRRDGIDILIDLTMHMGQSRPLIFARKPAPVRVCYLAYAGTTGMEAMDYRLTDSQLDPPGMPELYAEKSIRLESYWCYKPSVWDIPVAPTPATKTGFVTFGCLNNFGKINARVSACWVEILRAVSNSHLILHGRSGSHRETCVAAFASAEIDRQRIEFVPMLNMREYYSQYSHIDIALDTFPYAGGTTTCDALWMGVPTVTSRGELAVSRGGASILSLVGYDDLIANSSAEYVEIAIQLANDLAGLTQRRAAVRERMSGSRLMDAKAFAADVERCYSEIWNRWCEGI